jgi:hypothetical protein
MVTFTGLASGVRLKSPLAVDTSKRVESATTDAVTAGPASGAGSAISSDSDWCCGGLDGALLHGALATTEIHHGCTCGAAGRRSHGQLFAPTAHDNRQGRWSPAEPKPASQEADHLRVSYQEQSYRAARRPAPADG